MPKKTPKKTTDNGGHHGQSSGQGGSPAATALVGPVFKKSRDRVMPHIAVVKQEPADMDGNPLLPCANGPTCKGRQGDEPFVYAQAYKTLCVACDLSSAAGEVQRPLPPQTGQRPVDVDAFARKQNAKQKQAARFDKRWTKLAKKWQLQQAKQRKEREEIAQTLQQRQENQAKRKAEADAAKAAAAAAQAPAAAAQAPAAAAQARGGQQQSEEPAVDANLQASKQYVADVDERLAKKEEENKQLRLELAKIRKENEIDQENKKLRKQLEDAAKAGKGTKKCNAAGDLKGPATSEGEPPLTERRKFVKARRREKKPATPEGESAKRSEKKPATTEGESAKRSQKERTTPEGESAKRSEKKPTTPEGETAKGSQKQPDKQRRRDADQGESSGTVRKKVPKLLPKPLGSKGKEPQDQSAIPEGGSSSAAAVVPRAPKKAKVLRATELPWVRLMFTGPVPVEDPTFELPDLTSMVSESFLRTVFCQNEEMSRTMNGWKDRELDGIRQPWWCMKISELDTKPWKLDDFTATVLAFLQSGDERFRMFVDWGFEVRPFLDDPSQPPPPNSPAGCLFTAWPRCDLRDGRNLLLWGVVDLMQNTKERDLLVQVSVSPKHVKTMRIYYKDAAGNTVCLEVLRAKPNPREHWWTQLWTLTYKWTWMGYWREHGLATTDLKPPATRLLAGEVAEAAGPSGRIQAAPPPPPAGDAAEAGGPSGRIQAAPPPPPEDKAPSTAAGVRSKEKAKSADTVRKEAAAKHQAATKIQGFWRRRLTRRTLEVLANLLRQHVMQTLRENAAKKAAADAAKKAAADAEAAEARKLAKEAKEQRMLQRRAFYQGLAAANAVAAFAEEQAAEEEAKKAAEEEAKKAAAQAAEEVHSVVQLLVTATVVRADNEAAEEEAKKAAADFAQAAEEFMEAPGIPFGEDDIVPDTQQDGEYVIQILGLPPGHEHNAWPKSPSNGAAGGLLR